MPMRPAFKAYTPFQTLTDFISVTFSLTLKANIRAEYFPLTTLDYNQLPNLNSQLH
jgi:hypothetical protein